MHCHLALWKRYVNLCHSYENGFNWSDSPNTIQWIFWYLRQWQFSKGVDIKKGAITGPVQSHVVMTLSAICCISTLVLTNQELTRNSQSSWKIPVSMENKSGLVHILLHFPLAAYAQTKLEYTGPMPERSGNRGPKKNGADSEIAVRGIGIGQWWQDFLYGVSNFQIF